MRITIKNTINGDVQTKELIVKVQYDKTKPIVKHEKDEYGRNIFTIWQERKTTVSVQKYDPDKTASRTVYVGTTTCDYHDAKRYSKKLGKHLAWLNCINELVENNVVTGDEADALEAIELDATAFELDMEKKELKRVL